MNGIILLFIWTLIAIILITSHTVEGKDPKNEKDISDENEEKVNTGIDGKHIRNRRSNKNDVNIYIHVKDKRKNSKNARDDGENRNKKNHKRKKNKTHKRKRNKNKRRKKGKNGRRTTTHKPMNNTTTQTTITTPVMETSISTNGSYSSTSGEIKNKTTVLTTNTVENLSVTTISNNNSMTTVSESSTITDFQTTIANNDNKTTSSDTTIASNEVSKMETNSDLEREGPVDNSGPLPQDNGTNAKVEGYDGQEIGKGSNNDNNPEESNHQNKETVIQDVD